MRKRKNTQLYFYGLVAGLFQFGGAVALFVFGSVGLMGFASGSLSFKIVGLLGLIIGFALILWGKALRFDYQRQSGQIIHKGDW